MKKTDFHGHISDGWIDAGSLLGKKVELFFTDRRGGFSLPPYDSLNLAYHTGDQPDIVHLNREIVAKGLGIDAKRFIYLNQVHGVKFERVYHKDMSDPIKSSYEPFPGTDGGFTTESLLVLSVLTADCLPIALAEAGKGMVAMLHAGWRGTIKDIAGVALGRMREELGIRPERIKAVIGPGIGPCCYIVDEGRARIFVEKYGRDSTVVREEGGYHLDLFQANRINLLQAGLKEDNMVLAGGCTCCERRYFSFRREGTTGRQGAFIYIRE